MLERTRFADGSEEGTEGDARKAMRVEEGRAGEAEAAGG